MRESSASAYLLSWISQPRNGFMLENIYFRDCSWANPSSVYCMVFDPCLITLASTALGFILTDDDEIENIARKCKSLRKLYIPGPPRPGSGRTDTIPTTLPRTLEELYVSVDLDVQADAQRLDERLHSQLEEGGLPCLRKLMLDDRWSTVKLVKRGNSSIIDVYLPQTSAFCKRSGIQLAQTRVAGENQFILDHFK